jgi:hypothetical protein
MPQLNVDPQIAVTVVAILGAVSHAVVAILRAVQDYRVAIIRARNGTPLDTVTPHL